MLILPTRGVPAELRDLAQDALQYVLQDVAGQVLPVVTAAFWAGARMERVAAGEPWGAVRKHGASLVERQMLPADVAMERWAADLELGPREVSLLESLFQRRVSGEGGPIRLLPAEARVLHDVAVSAVGLERCRESLAEIAVHFP